MKKTLILGIGSVLMGDDAIGVRVIDELEKHVLPEGVSARAGDISGLDLLKHFSGFESVIIIDAAKMGEKPGTVKMFKSSEIKKDAFNDKFSTHGMALIETLTLSEMLGMSPEIDIIGIEPYNTDFSLDMTEGMKEKVPEIIDILEDRLSFSLKRRFQETEK